MRVNFAPSVFRRTVAQAADLLLRNRYFEENPSLSDDGVSLLARPGMSRFIDVGKGPIRGMISTAGTFNDAMFVVGGDTLFKIGTDRALSTVFTGLNAPESGVVNMAITASIGTGVPEYLFIADGRDLFVHSEAGIATGELIGDPTVGDRVEIAQVYYEFVSANVDAGSPDGSAGNPWKVLRSPSSEDSFGNLLRAINDTGVPGVEYSTGTDQHPEAQGSLYDAGRLNVASRVPGAAGNNLTTTVTSSSLTWANGGTMTGGNTPSTVPIGLPDGEGAIDVAVVASHVIVIPSQEGDHPGRFYWIKPGETYIDALDFATAESAPDGINGVKVLGDQFLLCGVATTEVWFPTGDADIPMRRVQGTVYDQGVWESTAVKVKDSVILCDSNGSVVRISGGQVQRVSNPAIEELIRKAIQTQQKVG